MKEENAKLPAVFERSFTLTRSTTVFSGAGSKLKSEQKYLNTNLPVAVFITTTHWFLKKVQFVVGLGKTEGFYKKTKSPPLQEQHQRCRVTHLEFPTAAALPETPSTHCSSLADGKKEKE